SCAGTGPDHITHGMPSRLRSRDQCDAEPGALARHCQATLCTARTLTSPARRSVVTLGLIRLLRQRARQYDRVPVGVAQPELPVQILAEVAWLQHLDIHVLSPLHSGLVVIQLEPEQNSISIGTD